MTMIERITLESPEPADAAMFVKSAFGVGDLVDTRSSAAPTTGFRGFAVSLVVAQPSTVDSLMKTAVDGGADTVKPAKKSLWGYGGVVQAPDGAVWQIATSSKKDTGPETRQIDDVVLLLGVENVKASKQFYVERGLTVTKSFGSKYVEFDTSPIKLALYGRRFAAKNAGVDPAGTGSHRIAIRSGAGPFTDPDGFVWEGVSG